MAAPHEAHEFFRDPVRAETAAYRSGCLKVFFTGLAGCPRGGGTPHGRGVLQRKPLLRPHLPQRAVARAGRATQRRTPSVRDDRPTEKQDTGAVSQPLCAVSRRRSSGIEYRLTHLRPPYLYVIRKEQRRADRDPRSLCSYYILDGTIFQAPTVEDVVTSRMAKCIYHLRQALSCVRA
eukprot:COSAG04_NODE_1035_length_8610_cov_7.441194_6_plen_178_part_00